MRTVPRGDQQRGKHRERQSPARPTPERGQLVQLLWDSAFLIPESRHVEERDTTDIRTSEQLDRVSDYLYIIVTLSSISDVGKVVARET